MNRQDVISHIEDYLNGKTSADDLGKWYFPLSKAERLGTTEAENRIYSGLFLDLDEYLPDEFLNLKTKFNIDDKELRTRLVQHVLRLKELEN